MREMRNSFFEISHRPSAFPGTAGGCETAAQYVGFPIHVRTFETEPVGKGDDPVTVAGAAPELTGKPVAVRPLAGSVSMPVPTSKFSGIAAAVRKQVNALAVPAAGPVFALVDAVELSVQIPTGPAFALGKAVHARSLVDDGMRFFRRRIPDGALGLFVAQPLTGTSGGGSQRNLDGGYVE